jgi:hypothetical protein
MEVASRAPAIPATIYQEDGMRKTSLTVREGFVGLHEEITERHYGLDGTVQFEHVERRTWIAPAARVPAPALRALSSTSFRPREEPAALPAPDENGMLRRLLSVLDLPAAAPAERG